MEAPGKEFIVQYPDQIAYAIQLLVGVVGVLACALVGVILYVWNKHTGEMRQISIDVQDKFETISDEFKAEISRVAKTLENISTTLFDRQRLIEIKQGEQETRCEERHAGRRETDKQRATEWHSKH